MTVLVVGAGGFLGAAMVDHLARAHDVVATTRATLDVRDHEAVNRTVRQVRPDAVINCSAYTDVDRAEDEPMLALDINAFAVRVLAEAARDVGAAFVHYSTDFVFDGTATEPYLETDQPNPRSTYACSKLIGEWLAKESDRAYVLRVESIFGASPAAPASPTVRRTSVDRIVDSIVGGQECRVFVDRTVSPSYSLDVATATEQLLVRRAEPGIYHCVNSGSCTWDQLAVEVGRQLGMAPKLIPMRMADAGLRANRPMFCVLSNRKLAAVGMPMPAWQDALRRYLASR